MLSSLSNILKHYLGDWKSRKVILFFLISIVTNCSFPTDLHKSQEKIDQIFEEKDVNPVYGNCNYKNKTISYTEVVNQNLSNLENINQPMRKRLPFVVFIHGSPGSWDNFLYYMHNSDLRAKANIISFDRLGYGKSDPSVPEISLSNHAHSIAECMNEIHPNSKWILVGHSYGGPVASKIAMDFPKNTAVLLLVAASIDPGLEKKEWFNTAAEWKIIQWIIPQELVTSNVEILELKNELESIQPDWEKIQAPTTIVHGEKDTLVPFENVAFARKHLINSKIEYVLNSEWNHFIPWNQKQVLLDAILNHLD